MIDMPGNQPSAVVFNSIYRADPNSMQKHCPNCNRTLASGAIICTDCGYRLDTGVFLATQIVGSEQPTESEWERGLSTSRNKHEKFGYVVQHVFLAFCVGVIGPMVHEAFTDIDYSPSHWYSFIALELSIPSFLLGFYFAPTATFPFRGFLGLSFGFLLGTQIINAWFGYGINFFLPLIAPTFCEMLGIVVGKSVANAS